MNYLYLTHDQVESIQQFDPLFDDFELPYHASIKHLNESFDHCLGREFRVHIIINWMEVYLNGKWFDIVRNGEWVQGALFILTKNQHDDIVKEVLKHD